MKVILTSDVYKHGVAGEVVAVSDGFARNYLIPRGLAVQAPPGAMKQRTKLRESSKARRAQVDNQLNELARQIDGGELAFGRRAGAQGKLYGSVTTQEIAEALLAKTGIDINRRRISQQAIRELGDYDVPVRLGSEFTPALRVLVMREEELEAYLKGDVVEEATIPEVAPELAGDKIKELIKQAEANTQSLETPEGAEA
jgi:large subunit ribosomal protein L9